MIGYCLFLKLYKNKQESLIYLYLEINHILVFWITKIEIYWHFISLSLEASLLPYKYEMFYNIRMKGK